MNGRFASLICEIVINPLLIKGIKKHGIRI